MDLLGSLLKPVDLFLENICKCQKTKKEETNEKYDRVWVWGQGDDRSGLSWQGGV